MPGPLIELLRRVGLFAELDDSDLQVIADAMREQTFPAGAVITVEGTVSDGFFVIGTGEAAVSVRDEARGTMGPGDCFGEIALLMGAERTATVTAIDDLTCFALYSQDFQAIVEGSPAIAWALVQSMTQRLE
jgi:voltage-gated potassium channel